MALVRGHLDQAVSRFSDALALEPKAARLYNDAAVAYLERGRRQGTPLDLLEALRHSLLALELAPRSPAALFNLGLALEKFQLRHQAIKVCKGYLQLDGSSAWAQEVRWRLKLSTGDSFRQDWNQWREVLRRSEPLAAVALHQVVQSYPDQVRELVVEELLPKVARELEEQSQTPGPAALLTSGLATEMAASRGDWLLSEALSSLEQGRGGRRRLTVAHRALAEAMVHYRAQNFSAAGQLLASAIPTLRAAGSPLAWEAQLYSAICVYYNDSGQARAQLRALVSEFDSERFPSLAGRALWMLGTSAMVQGHHEKASAAFRRMRSLLLRGAGEEQAANADQLLGENYELRGEVERGWRHRLRALQVLVPRGTSRRRYAVLRESAQALVRRHQLDLALVFLDEALAHAKEWGELPGRAEAFSLRARVWAELGNGTRAMADADSALAAVAAMQPGGLRLRLEGEALVSRGQARLASDPAGALRDLERGRWLEAQTGWLNDSTFAATLLASAHRSRGEISEARKSLIEAVQSYERMRGEAMETDARIAVFEHAQEAFESLMNLALTDADASLSEAFYWAERSRRRYLAESWVVRNAAHQSAATADAREILHRLPPDVTLIEFAVLAEQTVVWLAEGGELRGRVLPVARGRLTQQVARYRHALETSDDTARELGASLYDLLFRPLEPFGERGRRLVIVPDGPLEQVPFAALYDRERGQFLIERSTLALAPSATVLIGLLARQRVSSPPGGLAALVVGAPDLGQTSHADLGLLLGAKEEAKVIAGLYSRHTLLLGRQADRRRFLDELPRYGVLHFAGHSLALAGGGQSSLFLLAPSGDDDGEISAAEIRKLFLPKMELVVLAACRSLAGYNAGREGTLSLASSFLAAGAPHVVAAWWSVNDRTSPRLMHRFHALVASGSDPPEALREVMLQCIHSGDRELRAPRSWAVFTIIGN